MDGARNLGPGFHLGLIAPLTVWPTSAVGWNSMPKNLLILKFLYGRDCPRGLLASKELPSQDADGLAEHKFLSALPRPPAGPHAVEKLLLAKFAKIKRRQDAL